MRTIYDILFNNYLTSDVAEVKLKIMELINFVFEQSQSSHHLIDYFTSNQHLFESFANPLFTLCIQHGKYSSRSQFITSIDTISRSYIEVLT